VKNIFKQAEFSAIIGVEGKLPYNFSVGARYKYGLSDINNSEVSMFTDKWATQAIQVYASYTIPHKS
jgi:hypothetical protein